MADLTLQLQNTAGDISEEFQSPSVEALLTDQQYDLVAQLPDVSAIAVAGWPADDLINQLTVVKQQIDQQQGTTQKTASTTTKHVVVPQSTLTREQQAYILTIPVTYYTENDVAMVTFDEQENSATPPPNPAYTDLTNLLAFFQRGRNSQSALLVVSK